jgi:hypothetical protein
MKEEGSKRAKGWPERGKGGREGEGERERGRKGES